MNKIKLLNGIQIPQIGIGTWQITDKEIIDSIIKESYQLGYQLIDTAAAYSNEIAIGRALVNNSIKREEVFLTDKVWNSYRSYNGVQEACKKSLKKLKTDFFDSYLIHWPASMKLYPETWKDINAEVWGGLEAIYKQGLARSIGVCNFKIHHLEALMKTALIKPMINQIEFHPGINQEEMIKYCKKNNIILEASSPLGNGQILQNKTLLEISKSRRKTIAQICLRYSLQKGFVVIPKTTSKNRLLENINIFDFELTEEEIKILDSIPYCGGIGIDSDEVVQFG